MQCPICGTEPKVYCVFCWGDPATSPDQLMAAVKLERSEIGSLEREIGQRKKIVNFVAKAIKSFQDGEV